MLSTKIRRAAVDVHLACIINSSRVRIFYTHSGSAFSSKCLSFERVCINHWNNLKMVIEWSAKKVDFHLEIAIKEKFCAFFSRVVFVYFAVFFCARGLLTSSLCNTHWMEKWNLMMMMIFFFALIRTGILMLMVVWSWKVRWEHFKVFYH